MTQPTLNPLLQDFWQQPARGYCMYGGRSSSKSWEAAGFCVWVAANYKARFMCVRQFQNRIADSVYTLLVHQIERFGLRDEFKILESSIIHRRTGSEFLFYGLARNLNEIKSTEGVSICWVEEAEQLTAQQWEILEPTVRQEGSFFIVVFNPRYMTDFAYQRFVVSPPVNWRVRQVNYTDNPFLSQTMRASIDAMRAEDEAKYQHIYLGVPLEDTEDAVIKRSWIEAAVDAHIKLGFAAEGTQTIGFDVADSGADACALLHRHGSVALWADEWYAAEDELLRSCTKAWTAARERGADIRYDCIGVGASAGAKFDELNHGSGDHVSAKVRYSKFNAGGPVERPDAYYVSDEQGRIKNRDYFANVKAQFWWSVADRFRNTYNAVNRGEVHPPEELISLSSAMPHLEKLKTELATPRRDFDNNGRVKVESKADMAKSNRVGGAAPSPNIADAFIMAFANVGPKPLHITAETLARFSGRR